MIFKGELLWNETFVLCSLNRHQIFVTDIRELIDIAPSMRWLGFTMSREAGGGALSRDKTIQEGDECFFEFRRDRPAVNRPAKNEKQ